ncbi:MAG TPA: site-2 protease family protein [Gemmatimonadales bacterium]|nr:site-2 protease family protein [Gemmatimonadales bacterium]
MFGKQIQLFRLFGFPIRVDASWLVVAALATWSLASGYFPLRLPGLSPSTYWAMGVAGALGLFAAIVVHEMFHALVARRNGIPMRGITLFIFGGVAEMTGEPRDAKAELLMAAAGPFASILIALACYALALAGRNTWPTPITAVLGYLAVINAVLAGFNLLPAFPLDGGRIFRAILWRWKGDLRRATQTAARVGAGFSVLFMALGVVSFVGGDFISGVWWFLIAMFLRQAAIASSQQIAPGAAR